MSAIVHQKQKPPAGIKCPVFAQGIVSCQAIPQGIGNHIANLTRETKFVCRDLNLGTSTLTYDEKWAEVLFFVSTRFLIYQLINSYSLKQVGLIPARSLIKWEGATKPWFPDFPSILPNDWDLLDCFLLTVSVFWSSLCSFILHQGHFRPRRGPAISCRWRAADCCAKGGCCCCYLCPGRACPFSCCKSRGRISQQHCLSTPERRGKHDRRKHVRQHIRSSPGIQIGKIMGGASRSRLRVWN